MNNFDTAKLSNEIKIIYRKNPNTPRLSINIFIDSGTKAEKKPGIASLASRLLLQGTEKRTAEEIADEIDLNAIELGVDAKHDYTKLSALCLNEDLEKALDILADILKNSTFKNFTKEVRKFKGEIEVDLESPKTKAADNLVKNMYPNHPYGHSHTVVLESLESICEDDVKNYHFSTLNPQKMNIVVVGDVDKDKILLLLEENFGNIKQVEEAIIEIKEIEIPENKTVTIEKYDAAQAQVLQGWIVANIASEDYNALSVLNTILGSSGLSSRLFLELRDKKGLAYVVRSSYEPLKHSGNFSVYIATEPKNIKTSLEGFKNEIKKLQEVLVPEKELEDAKSNILGKRACYHETNSQQAHYLGHYDILGLGADYDEKIAEKIAHVTAEDLKNVANKYLSGNSIISVLAPEANLKEIH